jgi:hypothetical protein
MPRGLMFGAKVKGEGNAGELGWRLAKSLSGLHEPQCPPACAGRSSAPLGWRLPAHFISSAYVVRPCCSISRPWAAFSAFDRFARSSKNVVASQPANTPEWRADAPHRRARGLGVASSPQGKRLLLRLDRVMTAAGLARPPISRPRPPMDGVSQEAASRRSCGQCRPRPEAIVRLPNDGNACALEAGGLLYA